MRFLCAIALLAAACQDELSPPERIVNLRVLGVRAEPPDGIAGTDVTLDALVVHPDADLEVEQIWLACVAPPGVDSVAPCGLEEGAPAMPPPCAETDGAELCTLGLGPSVTYRLPERARVGRAVDQPGLAIITTVAALTSEGGLLGCVEAFQAEGTVPGFCRVALKRVRVMDPSQPLNANPTIESIDRAGDVVTITPAGLTSDEHALVSWFITAGEISTFRTDGEDAFQNTWSEVPAGARLWVVLRDGAGGEDWANLSNP